MKPRRCEPNSPGMLAPGSGGERTKGLELLGSENEGVENGHQESLRTIAAAAVRPLSRIPSSTCPRLGGPIEVARVRTRPRKSVASNLLPLLVEITAVFQLDCMISGIVPHLMTSSPSALQPRDTVARNGSVRSTVSPILTSFLVVAYSMLDTALLTGNEETAP